MHDRDHWRNAVMNILMAWKGGDILKIYNAVCNNHAALQEIETYFSAPLADGVGLTDEERAFLNTLTKDLNNELR